MSLNGTDGHLGKPILINENGFARRVGVLQHCRV